MEWMHVYPLKDLIKHATTAKGTDDFICQCDPKIDPIGLIIHDSLDRREVYETKDEEMARLIFEIALVRHFGIGFTIASPSLNGLHLEVSFACFIFRFWSKGTKLFGASNYWVKQSTKD